MKRMIVASLLFLGGCAAEDVNTTQDEIMELETVIEDMESRISELESQVTDLETNIEDLKYDAEEADSRIYELEYYLDFP